MYYIILVVGLLYLLNVIFRAYLFFQLPFKNQREIGYIGLCLLLTIPYQIENKNKNGVIGTLNLFGKIYYVNIVLLILCVWLGHYLKVI